MPKALSDFFTEWYNELYTPKVGGHAATVSLNPVLTVAGAYSTGDFVGTSATPLIFTGIARVSGGTGTIKSALLVDKALQSIAIELWLFDTIITPPADNAAWTITDAEALTCIGVIPFLTYYTSAANSVSPVPEVGIGYKATATTFWGALVTRGTPTYASLDLEVRLNVQPD